MSGTLTLTASIDREFGESPQLPLTLEQLEIALTNQQLHLEEWVVGTTEEDMAVGDVSSLGYLVLVNTDDTNYVQWGPKSGGAMVAAGRLKPGRWSIIELEPGITITAKANAAAVKVFKALFGT